MVGQATTSTFVGRAAELAQLSAVLERAKDGAAAAVLISGEAGVGKSRLIEALVEKARRDGTLTLVGRCIDFADGELAYAPITGALRSLPDLLDEAGLARGGAYGSATGSSRSSCSGRTLATSLGQAAEITCGPPV